MSDNSAMHTEMNADKYKWECCAEVVKCFPVSSDIKMEQDFAHKDAGQRYQNKAHGERSVYEPAYLGSDRSFLCEKSGSYRTDPAAVKE